MYSTPYLTVNTINFDKPQPNLGFISRTLITPTLSGDAVYCRFWPLFDNQRHHKLGNKSKYA